MLLNVQSSSLFCVVYKRYKRYKMTEYLHGVYKSHSRYSTETCTFSTDWRIRYFHPELVKMETSGLIPSLMVTWIPQLGQPLMVNASCWTTSTRLSQKKGVERFTQATGHFSQMEKDSRIFSFHRTQKITFSAFSVWTGPRKSSGMVGEYSVTGHMKYSLLFTITHPTGSTGALLRETFGNTTDWLLIMSSWGSNAPIHFVPVRAIKEEKQHCIWAISWDYGTFRPP